MQQTALPKTNFPQGGQITVKSLAIINSVATKVSLIHTVDEYDAMLGHVITVLRRKYTILKFSRFQGLVTFTCLCIKLSPANETTRKIY